MLTFRKIGYIAAIAAAGVLGASAASAAVYDFDLEANNNGERGELDGALIDVNNSGNIVGVAGYKYNGNGVSLSKDYFAYFDAGDAGLGVCKMLTCSASNVPNNSGDDNIQVGEALGLNFGVGTLNSVSFRDANHNSLGLNDSFLYSTNGLNYLVGQTDANGVWAAPQALTQIGIFFTASANGPELYVRSADFVLSGPGPNGGPSPVPLPAGGLLLLTALAGLGAARKRAKKS